MPYAVRVEFSKEHDAYLYKYLARYCPTKEGRSGQKVYQRLVSNEGNAWPWSTHHTSQSWRERYVRNAARFDVLIQNYQRKHNIKALPKLKRAAEPMPIEMLAPNVKRVRLESEEGSGSEIEQAAAAPLASSSSQKSNLAPERPHQPQQTPLAARPTGKPKSTDIRPPSPRPTSDANTDTTTKPPLGPAGQMQQIPSPSPDQPAPLPTNGEPAAHSPPRSAKRKERPRVPSEVFASQPPTPSKDSAARDAGGAPIPDTVYPRAPPRVVNLLHGQVLADRKGHAPRPFPRAQEGETEEEAEVEDRARWPPPRGRTAKPKTTSESDNRVDTHHAFSQLQPPLRPEGPPESADTGERGTIAGVAERPDNTARNGASPVKPIALTAPAPGPVPKPTSKPLKFPAPRASTCSPFRPEPPAGKVRAPAPRPPSRTRTRHPAVTRIRRQTIGQGLENGRGRWREHGQVPSVDLVALSRSSSSARSHSSAGVPTTRPPRWSLPAYAHPVPWASDEPGGAGSGSGSGSGSPFRWLPSYADARGHARTSSTGAGTSTHQFVFTPSPARSLTGVPTAPGVTADAPSAIPGSPSLSISTSVAPHPSDVSLTAAHGLASILAHMSGNHGLAPGVVEAVYRRVGSLREADEVLKGMREAAEAFGEREIEKRAGPGRGSGGRDERGARGERRRESGRRTTLRYVVTSEDGEGLEYSPPETSRAAMWKQQSESASYAEEGEHGEQDDEDEEEGRAVEEELWEGVEEAEAEPDNGKVTDGHDPFSRALLDNIEADELEKEMGRRQFHKEIVRRFAK